MQTENQHSNTSSHPAGWVIFRRGGFSYSGKVHYMVEDNLQSICGYLKLKHHEKEYVHFVNDGEFFKGKKCERCVLIAKSHGISLK